MAHPFNHLDEFDFHQMISPRKFFWGSHFKAHPGATFQATVMFNSGVSFGGEMTCP